MNLNRCAITFESAKDLKAAFDRVNQTKGLRFVRVKNNFDPNFDAAKESFGYVVHRRVRLEQRGVCAV